MKNKTIWLQETYEAHPDHLPQELRIDRSTELPTSPYFYRLERDGWIPQYQGDKSNPRWHNYWQYNHPLYWHKYNFDQTYYLIMEKIIQHTKSVYTYGLYNINVQDETLLDNFTWVDWDHRGRLVGARDGQIVAMNPEAPNEDVTILEDFNDQRPDPQPAPGWARRW